MSATTELAYVNPELLVEDADGSDDEQEADGQVLLRAKSVKGANAGLISRVQAGFGDHAFIRIETGTPVCLYVTTGTRPQITKAGATFGLGWSGVKAKVEIERALLDANTSQMILEPPDANASRKSQPFYVGNGALVSVQRLQLVNKKYARLDQWDCINMPVQPGKKIIICGGAASAAACLGIPV